MDFFLTLWASAAADESLLSTILSYIWRFVLVLLGINALIIVHEWGHFIVARMCGVRCDKFYIWFDAWGYKFFHFKWGDTEYGLGWLPLGGYVKMLGQEDNPGGIKAELERARQGVDENGEKLETIDENKVAELEKAAYAPDSYLSKNVPQRMAIISAGVIMNVIFAVFCGFIAALLGLPQLSNSIGQILPGTPAWEQGLQPGDRIVDINGKPNELFQNIQLAMLDGEKVELEVERGSDNQKFKLNIIPELEQGGMVPTIGVKIPSSLKLAEVKDPWEKSLDDSENKAREALYSGLVGGNIITAINGQPVKNTADFDHLSQLYIDQPITYSLDSSKTIELPPLGMKEFGIRLTMGEITKIQKNSPAEKVGLLARHTNEKGEVVQKGDIIIAVNNEPILDPVKFPYNMFLKVRGQKNTTESGKSEAGIVSVVLTVLRDNQEIEVPMTLARNGLYSGILSKSGCLASGQLGITYEVTPVISGVEPTIGIKEGESPLGGHITSISVTLPKKDKKSSPDVQEIYSTLHQLASKTDRSGALIFTDDANNAEQNYKIISFFTNYIYYLPDNTPLKIEVKRVNGENIVLDTKVQTAKDAFLINRGLLFKPDYITYKAVRFTNALKWGWDKTVENMCMIFTILRRMGSTVSTKALGGPIMIVGVTWAATSTNDGLFFLLLCMLGANLAVVNFLPIPVLDGGHMVFLIYEAIFRKPANENVQIILSYIGLFLILALMFWVIFLDLQRYIFGGL